MTQDGERHRPSEQKVSAVNGFYINVSKSPVVRRPYYHKCYSC